MKAEDGAALCRCTCTSSLQSAIALLRACGVDSRTAGILKALASLTVVRQPGCNRLLSVQWLMAHGKQAEWRKMLCPPLSLL
jgi:hypothetical protein